MKRISALFFILLMLVGCDSNSAKMGDDPAIDGAEMMIECLTALKEGDKAKANDVLGEYIAYYSDKSPEAKVAFCTGASEEHWNEMYLNPTTKWVSVLRRLKPLMEWYVTSEVAVTSLPNYEKLREWYQETEKPDTDQ